MSKKQDIHDAMVKIMDEFNALRDRVGDEVSIQVRLTTNRNRDYFGYSYTNSNGIKTKVFTLDGGETFSQYQVDTNF